MRLAAALIALTVFASSSFSENVRQIITQRYAEVTKAMQTHNLKPVASILAPDYKALGPSGKFLGREDILKQFQFQANSVTGLQWPRTITSLKTGKNSVQAVVSGRLSAYTKQKPKRHLELLATTKDTWKKMDGRWLLSSSELVKSQMLMDGKPVSFGHR